MAVVCRCDPRGHGPSSSPRHIGQQHKALRLTGVELATPPCGHGLSETVPHTSYMYVYNYTVHVRCHGANWNLPIKMPAVGMKQNKTHKALRKEQENRPIAIWALIRYGACSTVVDVTEWPVCCILCPSTPHSYSPRKGPQRFRGAPVCSVVGEAPMPPTNRRKSAERLTPALRAVV